DACGKRIEHLLRSIRCYEDVDVEIARSSRFLGAVGECDRSAERVRQTGGVERHVDSKDTLREPGHPRSRFNGGYPSVFFGLQGRCSARSSTSSKMRALRS